MKTVGYLPLVNGQFLSHKPTNKGLKTIAENKRKAKILAEKEKRTQQTLLQQSFTQLLKLQNR